MMSLELCRAKKPPKIRIGRKDTVTTIVPIDSVGLRGRVAVSPAGLEWASVAPTIDTVAETHFRSATFMTATTNPLVKDTVTTMVPIDSVRLRGRVGVSLAPCRSGAG